jgi:hypothetical protein
MPAVGVEITGPSASVNRPNPTTDLGQARSCWKSVCGARSKLTTRSPSRKTPEQLNGDLKNWRVPSATSNGLRAVASGTPQTWVVIFPSAEVSYHTRFSRFNGTARQQSPWHALTRSRPSGPLSGTAKYPAGARPSKCIIIVVASGTPFDPD